MRSMNIMPALCFVLIGCNVIENPDVQDEAGTCTDGRRNGAESDVDCGGDACGSCIGGSECKAAADCRSSICRSGRCIANLAISDISPKSGPTTGGIPVTIEGDDFKTGIVVT